MNGRRARLGLLAVATLVAAGCAAPGLFNMWRNPEVAAGPMRRWMVVAMREDQATRRLWEDGFVRELARHGVEVVPSYHLYSAAIPDTHQMAETLQDAPFDLVLLTRPVRDGAPDDFEAGYSATPPVGSRQRLDAAYRSFYREPLEPGPAGVGRSQTAVWSTAARGRLVWTGTSAPLDAASPAEVSREIGRRVVPELVRQGIVPGRR